MRPINICEIDLQTIRGKVYTKHTPLICEICHIIIGHNWHWLDRGRVNWSWINWVCGGIRSISVSICSVITVWIICVSVSTVVSVGIIRCRICTGISTVVIDSIRVCCVILALICGSSAVIFFDNRVSCVVAVCGWVLFLQTTTSSVIGLLLTIVTGGVVGSIITCWN